MNEREKLVELLNKAIRYAINNCKNKDPKAILDTPDVADYLLANGVTVQRWIPVTERLPEKWGEYLVMIEGDKRSTTLYYEWADKYWFDFPNGRKFVVTHWMPLPPAPEDVK
jgi:hypothetical protein